MKFNITKLLFYYSKFQQQEPNFKFHKNHGDLIDKGRYLRLQICKICYSCDGSLLGNISATLEHLEDFVHIVFLLMIVQYINASLDHFYQNDGMISMTFFMIRIRYFGFTIKATWLLAYRKNSVWRHRLKSLKLKNNVNMNQYNLNKQI